MLAHPPGSKRERVHEKSKTSAAVVVPYQAEIYHTKLYSNGVLVGESRSFPRPIMQFDGFIPRDGDKLTLKTEVYYDKEGDGSPEDDGRQSVEVRMAIYCASNRWQSDPKTVTAPSYKYGPYWPDLGGAEGNGAPVSFDFDYNEQFCIDGVKQYEQRHPSVPYSGATWFGISIIHKDPAGNWPDFTYSYGDTINGAGLATVPTDQTFGASCGSNSASVANCQNRIGGVNTATGAYSTSAVDAELASEMPFGLSRSYSSNNKTSGILGSGWTAGWDTSLSTSGAGDVTFHSEDGSSYTFEKTTSGDFEAPLPVHSTLSSTASGYSLKTTDGRTLSYDSAGRALAIKDKQGRQVTYTRNGDGRLDSLTNSIGRQSDFSYDSDGKLSQITLSDGRHIKFEHSGGRLTNVTGVDGRSIAYEYDSNGLLDTVTGPGGAVMLHNTYDSKGRVADQTNALGSTAKFSYKDGETDVQEPDGGIWTDIYSGNVLLAQYDPFGNKTSYAYSFRLDPVSVTDALGNTKTTSIDRLGRVVEFKTPTTTRRWSYQANGDLSTYYNGNNKSSSYKYDTSHHLSTSTDPLGKTTSYTYTAGGQQETRTNPLGKVTRYGYDSAGNQTSVTQPDGSRLTRAFDTSGRVTSVVDERGNEPDADPSKFQTAYRYDDAGRVTAKINAAGNTTKYEYDAAGNLATVTDAATKATNFTYNAANLLTEAKDSAGHSVWTTYDVLGNVASRTDATGAKTTYTYDKAGRLLTMTSPRGNISGADASKFTWKYGYDKVGNQTTVTDPLGNTTKTDYDAEYRPVAVTDPLGHVHRTEYDDEGNVIKTVDALGKAAGNTYDANNQLLTATDRGGKAVTYTYDDAGNLASTTTPRGSKTTYGYDDNGRLTTTVEPRGNATGADPAQYTWSTAYDAAGHVRSQSNPYGTKLVTYSYDGDGRLSDQTDALGNTTAYEYDELGRLSKVTAPDHGTTSLGYDTAGNLTSRKDANDHTTRYAYDDSGRLLKITDPLNRSTSYGYDANGNRTSTTNARGQKLTSSYDARNLLTQTTYSDGTATAAYTYDAAGQPKTIKDGTGTRTLTYDDEGRPLTITSPGATNPFKYAYNDNGTLKSRTYPDGRATSYSYDGDGHILGQTAGGKTTNYTWDAAGNQLTSKLPTTTAVTEARTYDRAGQLASVSQGTGARFVDRDANGRVTKEYYKDASTTGLADRYAYDPAGRLTRACTDTSATDSCLTNSSGSTYNYDEVGNLTSSSTPTSTRNNTYDDADQLTRRVEGTTTVDYTYDADGNLTKDANGTYTSDPLGRVKSATLGSDTYTFVNDADDNRTVTNKNGALARTSRWDVVNPLAQIATDTGSTGSLIADYHYNPDGIAESQNRSSGTFYMRHDRQNNVTAVYDAAGKENYTYTYSAWGVPTAKASITDGQTSVFGYTGQYKDPYLTGRLDLRERGYDPANRRFTAPDPDPATNDSPNLAAYAYANNDPINQSDPSGRCPLCVSAGIGAVLGAAVEGGIYGWQHRNGGFTWGGFAQAAGKGAVTGGIAGALMPGAGNAAVRALGLTGGRALATSTAVNAAVGAGFSWAVNAAHCQPTTPRDLLIGAAGGGSSSLLGPAFSWLKGKFPRSSAPTRFGPGAAHADDPALRGGSPFSLASIPEEPGFNYLYRGVSTASPAYDDAVEGIARPRGGSASMETHHDGNTDSIYTSWTTSKQTALAYARGAAEGRSDLPGVILQVKLPLGQPVYPSIMFSTELWESNENLVEGLVNGARVFHVPAG
ncbi:RHS repeat-associated core domain-containing protein [Streptomyces sp. 1222.5]|nr:RHS repeat-associated protein [Streptomyces sp. 5112.2]SEC00570.1 RHS repeat-associated core domain-containing protein [Streptomyces sp. 1222.5]